MSIEGYVDQLMAAAAEWYRTASADDVDVLADVFDDPEVGVLDVRIMSDDHIKQLVRLAEIGRFRLHDSAIETRKMEGGE